MLEVCQLEHDLDVLVVVKEILQVIDSLGINVFVEDDPLTLVKLSTDVVYDLPVQEVGKSGNSVQCQEMSGWSPEEVREEPVIPLLSVGVEYSVQVILAECLGGGTACRISTRSRSSSKSRKQR